MGRNKSFFKIKTEYYFYCKNETTKARKKYEDFLNDARRILKYENQLDCDKDYYLNKALGEYGNFYVMGDGTHPFYSERVEKTYESLVHRMNRLKTFPLTTLE